MRTLADSTSFASWLRTTQERLGARLAGSSVSARLPPLPQNVAPLFANAERVDRDGWLSRPRGSAVLLCRPVGAGTFGPSEAHSLDATLLEHFAAPVSAPEARTLVLLGDSAGHEVSRRAEALCVSQFLAQHAAVLALLRARGVTLRGLLSGVGHSAEFFSHVLQANEATALAGARVVAMEPAALARVTGLPQPALAALIENDPLLGHPVRHFAAWAGWDELLPDADPDRLRAFALGDPTARR